MVPKSESKVSTPRPGMMSAMALPVFFIKDMLLVLLVVELLF
jgi:hypothetical protein